MAKGSGGTRLSKTFDNDKYMNDLFHSTNQYISKYLRGLMNRSDYSESRLSENEIKESIKYMDNIFSKSKLDSGTAYRNLGFKTEKDFNEFIYRTLNFTDNTYQDKGYSFVSLKHGEDIYGGGSNTGHYTVELTYENAKYLDFGKIQKGYIDTGVINRNEKYNISDVKVSDSGKHIYIKLKR